MISSVVTIYVFHRPNTKIWRKQPTIYKSGCISTSSLYVELYPLKLIIILEGVNECFGKIQIIGNEVTRDMPECHCKSKAGLYILHTYFYFILFIISLNLFIIH
jgi:hypothetical protein